MRLPVVEDEDEDERERGRVRERVRGGSMSPDVEATFAVEMARRALVMALQLSLPMLLIGLIVGLLVSLFQALTQIQEQTLSFIPKIISVGATLFILLPWMLMELSEYTRNVFAKLTEMIP